LFCSDLLRLTSIIKCKIILCPIGLAPGHEDDKILREIANYSKDFIFVLPKNISEIMNLISNATAYIGTSLHGLITAQSYGVPFIPLRKRTEKIKAYCDTWFVEKDIDIIDFSELPKVEAILNNWNYKEMLKTTKAQKKKVYKNFESLLKYVN
jgi:polysaccharide pyruvyl transferase WcaK-like protein